MKNVAVVLLLFFAGASVEAQVRVPTPDPSGISVIKFSWSKERIGWEQDPFGGPIESFGEMRVRAQNEKRVADAKKGGSDAEVSRAERDAKTDEALVASIHKNGNTRYVFVYRLLLQNNDTRSIKSIDWDYVFYDKSTGEEVGRRQFASDAKIASGKTKELKFFIPTPPARTISITSLNKREREGLNEAIVIARVEFVDGSLWKLQ